MHSSSIFETQEGEYFQQGSCFMASTNILQSLKGEEIKMEFFRFEEAKDSIPFHSLFHPLRID
jgi:hypothetical protein